MTGIYLAAGNLSPVHSVDPSSFTTLRGYSLKNDPGPQPDFNLWVVTNEVAFNQEFIAGEQATGKPDFENQLVVGASAQTERFRYRVDFLKTSVDKNGINIYFHVVKFKPGQEIENNVSLAAIAKNSAAKKVNFYHDNILVKSIPIVSVY